MDSSELLTTKFTLEGRTYVIEHTSHREMVQKVQKRVRQRCPVIGDLLLHGVPVTQETYSCLRNNCTAVVITRPLISPSITAATAGVAVVTNPDQEKYTIRLSIETLRSTPVYQFGTTLTSLPGDEQGQQVPNPLRGMARGGRVIELTADRTLLAYGSNQQKFKDALMKLPEVADFHEEPVPRSGVKGGLNSLKAIMDVLIDKVTYMRLHLVRLAGGDPRVVVIFRAASKLRAVICREEELNQRYFDLVTAPGRVYRDSEMKPFIEARKLGLALDLDQTVVDQHITKQDYERLKEDPKYAGHVHSFRSEKGHMVYIVVIPGIGDWLRELSEKFYLYVVTRSIDVHRTAITRFMETQAGYEPDHLFTNGRSLREEGKRKTFSLVGIPVHAGIGLDDDHGPRNWEEYNQIMDMTYFKIRCLQPHGRQCRPSASGSTVYDLCTVCEGEQTDWPQLLRTLCSQLKEIHKAFFQQYDYIMSHGGAAQHFVWDHYSAPARKPSMRYLGDFIDQIKRRTSRQARSPSPLRGGGSPSPSPPRAAGKRRARADDDEDESSVARPSRSARSTSR